MNKKRTTEFNVLAYMKAHTKSLPKIPKDILLWDWLDYWSENLCINIKPSTKNSYDAVINNHIKRVFPSDYQLSALTFEDIQLFINSLVEGVGLKEPLSPKTIKNINGVFHRCLSMAKKYEIIDKNLATNVVLPKRKLPMLIPFNTDEVKQFLNLINGHRFEMLYTFALFSGLREGELIGLTWDCFDFDHNRVFVYRQLSLNKLTRKYYFSSIKNTKPRTIIIATSIMNMMKKYKENISSEYVFPNKNTNDHLTHASVRHAFKKIVKKMGKPQFRFHDLRHTYAVLQLLAGVDPKTISENLGHYSVGFTLDVYAFCLSQMKKDGAEKLEQLYNEIKKKE